MNTRNLSIIINLIIFLMPNIINAQTIEEELSNISWLRGPSLGNIGEIAEIKVPEGYVFAGVEDTKKLMEIMQNPISNKELGFIAPESLEWFVVFQFSNIGYVRDDEKNSLDADAILKSLIKGNDDANNERRKRNWPILSILGWHREPHYDPLSNNLEWSIRGECAGDQVINYNTRLLGRKGVMEVILVGDPQKFEEYVPSYKGLLSGYNFKPGNTYAEYKKGDKISEYGLTALVAGGATAVAAKAGVFKWLGKILIAIGVAIMATFNRIISWIKGLFSSK